MRPDEPDRPPSRERSGDSTDALLLRSVDYRESDRVVTLLTRADGKISCIARGARRSKKRFGGSLQPLALLRVRVQSGRGQLAVLQEAELARHFPNVIADLDRMAAGYAAVELLRELCPEHHPEPAMLELALEMLAALDDPGRDPEVLTIGFETRLLALAGFAPMLDACGSCGKQPAATQPAAFDAVHGHLVCQACGGAPDVLSGATRVALAQAVAQDWRDAAAGLTPSERTSAARAMRSWPSTAWDERCSPIARGRARTRRPSALGDAR